MHSSPFDGERAVNARAGAQVRSPTIDQARVRCIDGQQRSRRLDRNGRPRQSIEVVGLEHAARRPTRASIGRSRRTCRRRSASCSSTTAPSTPSRAGAAVYGSWRLAILPQDEPYLPAGFATVGAGAHPLVRGLGKAWWSLTGRAHRSLPVHGVSEAAFAPLDARRCAAHRPRVRAHTAVLSRRVRRAVPADRRAAGDCGRGRRVGCGEPRRRRRRRAGANLARRRSPAPQVSPAGAAPAHAAARRSRRRARGFSSSATATTSRRCSASATARSACCRYPRTHVAGRQLAHAARHHGGSHRHAAAWRGRSGCSRAT